MLSGLNAPSVQLWRRITVSLESRLFSLSNEWPLKKENYSCKCSVTVLKKCFKNDEKKFPIAFKCNSCILNFPIAFLKIRFNIAPLLCRVSRIEPKNQKFYYRNEQSELLNYCVGNHGPFASGGYKLGAHPKQTARDSKLYSIRMSLKRSLLYSGTFGIQRNK
jgi:hypothetical protein